MSREPSALKVTSLAVAYGKVKAVKDVSLSLAPGTIAAIIGPNGAGKTTLLSAIAGLLPSKGEIRLQDVALDKTTTAGRVALGLSLVHEQRDLFGTMDVRDNLLLGAFTSRRDKNEIKTRLNEVLTLFPKLGDRLDQHASTLSGGERQMLAVGRALMNRPKVLLLDEPSLGLAPLVVEDVFVTISKLRDLGVSTLVVEQNARMALRYADYGYVLENGSIAIEGKPASLMIDPRLLNSYLGVAAN